MLLNESHRRRWSDRAYTRGDSDCIRSRSQILLTPPRKKSSAGLHHRKAHAAFNFERDDEELKQVKRFTWILVLVLLAPIIAFIAQQILAPELFMEDITPR